MNTPRPVVAHIHLFKNAGTSVEAGLKAHFGDRWMSYDRTDSGGLIGHQHLAEVLAANPNIAALSSHQLRPPVSALQEVELFPLVFLRHPIDRIRSAYDFERRQAAATPSSEAARTNDLQGWIEFHRSRNSSQCSEFHVMALTELRWDETATTVATAETHEHLTSARDFLNSLPAFGIVEKYDDSWEWITSAIRSRFPAFTGPAVQANTTDRRLDSLDERLAATQDMLGTEAFEQLADDNKHDIALYEWARATAQLKRLLPSEAW